MFHKIITSLNRIWQSWVQVFARREDPRFLAAFRIGIGLSATIAVSSTIIADVVDMVWFDRAYGGIVTLYGNPPLIDFLGGPKPVVIWSFIALSLLSSIALTIGLFGKIAAFLTLQSMLLLLDLNPYAPGGGATLLLTNALWLLVLSRSSTTWSVDCFIKNRSWSASELVPAWPRYLAIVQLLLCYFCTGIQKVSIHWLPGGDFSALYYILQQPSWQRFDHSWLAWFFPLTQVGTATVWLWEITAPLWGILLWRCGKSTGLRQPITLYSVRWIYFSIGVVLHVLIFAFMDIGIFSLVSLSYYPCLLLASDINFFTSVMRPRWAQ